jgi:formamidopyrimidine-DNA glycosylase
MAELPEIVQLAAQMREKLRGKTLTHTDLLQEKCANLSQAEWNGRTQGAAIVTVRYKGKWILTELDNGETILLSLGMGADALYFPPGGSLPEKYQIKAQFDTGEGYTIRFWWFGKYLLTPTASLADEPNTKDIGLDPFDPRFTFEHFAALAQGKRTAVKAFLMNQRIIGGIGNMYMHDILFQSRLHPQKKLSDLTPPQLRALYDAVQGVLNLARDKGAFGYEMDFFGKKGGYNMEDFQVGYKENVPCPACGTPIVQIRTGGTATYLCPECQKL